MSFKKALIFVMALVLMAGLVGSSQVAQAQDEPPARRTITVTGYGLAYGAPDIAYIGLGVDAVNADIAAAMDDANARMNAVIEALQAAGVAPEDIRTEYFSIYQDYGAMPMPADSGMASDQPQRVYRVSNTMNVRVRNPEQIAELLAAAVNAGANVVNYVQFDLADRSTLESEARQDAVEDANARAQELAGLLGVTVGEPLTIVEGQNSYPGPMYGGGGGAADMAASAPPISQGTLSVNMSVTITYAVQ